MNDRRKEHVANTRRIIAALEQANAENSRANRLSQLRNGREALARWKDQLKRMEDKS